MNRVGGYEDPTRFPPTVGELDLYLIAQGTHRKLWTVLGAHARTLAGVDGTSFAVWAPNAQGVSVVGDFNEWDGRRCPLRSLGPSGIWEAFSTQSTMRVAMAASGIPVCSASFGLWAMVSPPRSLMRLIPSAPSPSPPDKTMATECGPCVSASERKNKSTVRRLPCSRCKSVRRR